jgi:F0F1-type ATP synthase epsilon subunit
MSMMLHIISPTKSIRVEIEWIELNTPVGNFVIKPGHIPTILTLVPNAPCTFLTSDGSQETIKPQNAVAEIVRSEVTLFMQD